MGPHELVLDVSDELPFEEQLWRNGYRGVLAPSAARPQHSVLCIFRDTEEVAGAVPLRPPLTYRPAPAPPTGMTT